MSGGFVSLTKGEDWCCCCICFEVHRAPYPNAAVDTDGVRWDVCKGKCAIDAGIVEQAEDR